MDQLRAGELLGQRYRLVEFLRPASLGTVWCAVDELTQRPVAVKGLGSHPAGDQVSWPRARLALQVISGLQHPGVAQVYDCLPVTVPGGATTGCLVRELVAGQTLEERLAEGALPLAEALGIVASVAEILTAVHQAGLAHGNLVPANVVLSPGGVRITDAGLWVLRDHPAVAVFPSALSYAAPERAAGGPATPATDMYSLGVVFAACLTGIAADGAGTAALADLPGDSAAEGLASLWAACLGASPQDRPSAAHAALMSRRLISAGLQPLAGPATAAAEPAASAGPAAAAGPVPATGPAAAAGPVPAGLPAPDVQPAPAPARPPRRHTRPGPARPGAVRGAAARRVAAGPRASRLSTARRGGLLAVGGAATGVTVAVVMVLAQLLTPPAAPAASPAPAPARAHATATATPGAGAGGAPASATAVPVPSPASPVTAVNQLWQSVRRAAADGQIRQDVAVDFENLIQPVRSQLNAGRPARLAPLVAALRGKLAARSREGAITASAARVLSGDLARLAGSARGG